MKKGFALLLSIIFVVVMAFIGVMVMQFASSSSHHSAESYLDTKASLALRSATEYGIMALQGHNFNKKGLVKEINLTYPIFNAVVKFHYFLTDCPAVDKNCTQIQTKDTNGSVLMYVTVTSKNSNFKLRKVRVTLQNL